MEIKVGLMVGTRLFEATVSDSDALTVVPDYAWEKMNISKRASFLTALGDMLAADYARAVEMWEPEVASQKIAEAKERMHKCLT